MVLVYLLFWMSYNQGYELGLAVDAPIWTDQVTEVPHLSTRPVARSVPTSHSMQCVPKSPSSTRFGADRLARIATMESWHFWFLGRQAIVNQLWSKYLSGCRDVLDLGCGTGHMSQRLADRGHRVVSLDLRPEGLLAMRAARSDACLVQAEAPYLPFAPGSFDAVVMLDVLEHVDDRALLRCIASVLRPTGWLILTVPALPLLWSYRDSAAGHQRRYTRSGLCRLIAEENYILREIRYYQCLLLPIMLASRYFGRHGPVLQDLEERPLPLINAILASINQFEVRLSEHIAWPWGSSLAAVCQKR